MIGQLQNVFAWNVWATTEIYGQLRNAWATAKYISNCRNFWATAECMSNCEIHKEQYKYMEKHGKVLCGVFRLNGQLQSFYLSSVKIGTSYKCLHP